MDSMTSNVLFRFDVLLHPRLFCFVINTADTCKYMLFTFSFEIDAPNIISCGPKIFSCTPKISAVRLKIYIW